jgi:hypothetical protein
MQGSGPLTGIDWSYGLVQITRWRRIDTLAQHLMEQRIQQRSDATHGVSGPNLSLTSMTEDACFP